VVSESLSYFDYAYSVTTFYKKSSTTEHISRVRKALDFLYFGVHAMATMTNAEKNKVVAHAKLWAARHKRTVDENEAYLDALMDMGVPDSVAMDVADILYTPIKLSNTANS